jgi:hypothetical protein
MFGRSVKSLSVQLILLNTGLNILIVKQFIAALWGAWYLCCVYLAPLNNSGAQVVISHILSVGSSSYRPVLISGWKAVEAAFPSHSWSSYHSTQSRGRSVVMTTRYGLDDRCSVWFPSGAGNFSLLHRIHTGSGVHPTPYQVDTGGSFLGG